MTPDLTERFIQEASELPPLPHAAQKALAVIRDPELSAGTLAAILASDQVLASRVLRWANSAYYGVENRIVTVQQAIMVLGLNRTRELILTTALSDRMNQALPGYGLKRGELWQHALGTALGAQLLSKKYHLRIDDEAYFAGLLCDIGKLIFETHLHEIDPFLEEWEYHSFPEVERAWFGLTHAELGAEIAKAWQLPENLVAAIAFHHEPQCAAKHTLLTAVVHVADVSMKVLGIGMGIDGLRYPMEEFALQMLQMNWEDIFALSERVAQQLEQVKKLIKID